MREKDFNKIEKKNNICIKVFCYEDGLVFPNTFQSKNLKTQWMYYSQLMVINRFMCTLKTYLCFTKQRIKTKNRFAEAVYSVSVTKIYSETIEKIV